MILFLVYRQNWVSELLCLSLPLRLHYKKIIRNIVINLIIKPKYIYIYQEIKLTKQIFWSILLWKYSYQILEDEMY